MSRSGQISREGVGAHRMLESAAVHGEDAVPDRPRVALYSRRAAEARVWHASQYEFEDIIVACDDAVLLAPPARSASSVRPVAHGVFNRARRAVGLPRRAYIQSISSAFDSDLFMAVFAAPHEIGALPHLRPAWERASKRAAFVVEMYRPGFADARDYLRQLRGFDHIFVFTRDVIGPIQELTGVPTSFLATGVDAPLFVPPSPAPERTIDVLSYGRRVPRTHEALVEAWRRGDFYYSFDTVRGPFDVNDHREHRAQLAATLQRARYVIIRRNNDDPVRALRTGGEETLSNRLFEAAAAGAVILGSAPGTPDFERYFPWTDAVVPVPENPADIPDLVRELDQQPARRVRAARAGALAALRGLDWSYRWRDILDAVGLPYGQRLRRRIADLHSTADELEAHASTGSR